MSGGTNREHEQAQTREDASTPCLGDFRHVRNDGADGTGSGRSRGEIARSPARWRRRGSDRIHDRERQRPGSRHRRGQRAGSIVRRKGRRPSFFFQACGPSCPPSALACSRDGAIPRSAGAGIRRPATTRHPDAGLGDLDHLGVRCRFDHCPARPGIHHQVPAPRGGTVARLRVPGHERQLEDSPLSRARPCGARHVSASTAKSRRCSAIAKRSVIPAT